MSIYRTHSGQDVVYKDFSSSVAGALCFGSSAEPDTLIKVFNIPVITRIRCRVKLFVGQEDVAEPKSGQEWFWTPEWQAAEREVEADLAAGRFETYDTMEDFLADLE